MSADDQEFFPELEEDAPESVKGWLECPKPPTSWPEDPREKVLAVTAYLETCGGLSLGEVAREHPKWFYAQFLKPLLPKETKMEIKTETLTEIQLDARIQHLVTMIGPEVVQKYVEIGSAAPVRVMGGQKALDEDDILS